MVGQVLTLPVVDGLPCHVDASLRCSRPPPPAAPASPRDQGPDRDEDEQQQWHAVVWAGQAERDRGDPERHDFGRAVSRDIDGPNPNAEYSVAATVRTIT